MSSARGGARRGDGGAGDAKMLSARVSKSNELSPVVNALASSARCANALKTSPHLPQRTWPPAARKTSADNLKTVSHLEHCVYTLGTLRAWMQHHSSRSMTCTISKPAAYAAFTA